MKLVAMVFPRIAAEETQDPEPVLSQYQLMGLHCTRRNMIPWNATAMIVAMATYMLYL
jgi:hypothetical protein